MSSLAIVKHLKIMPDFFFLQLLFGLIHMMLITEFLQFRPKGHQEPYLSTLSVIGSLCLAEHQVGFEPMNLIVIAMPSPTRPLSPNFDQISFWL